MLAERYLPLILNARAGAQGHAHEASEGLQGGDSIVSGQLVPGVQKEPPVLWFGSLPLVLVLAPSLYPRILQ